MAVKRDMDTIRTILLEVEEMELGFEWSPDNDLEAHNGHLLMDGRFAEGETDNMVNGTRRVRIRSLTWAGSELADSMRDSSLWAAVKSKVAAIGLDNIPAAAIAEIVSRL